MKRLVIIFILFVSIPLLSEAIGIGKVKKVVIDAGHGGNKPGAVGKKSKEKEITLALALKLGKLIKDNYTDVEVIYTRTKDVDVDLFQRAQIANRNKADLFISIHANSSKRTEPTGTETWVMGLAKSSANLEVAKKENADILLEDNYKVNYQGFDPNSPETHIMFALYQNAFLDKSLDFAAKVQKQFGEKIQTPNRGVKQAEFLVLYKTSIPAVLVEVGFISNLEEEVYMNSLQGQGELALSIFNAFREYKAQEENIELSANEKLVINIEGYDPARIGRVEKIVEKPQPIKEQPIVVQKIDSSSLPTQVVKNVEKPKEIAVAEKPKEEVKDVSKNLNTVNNATVEYRVQFFLSKQNLALNNSKFKGLNDVKVYEHEGLYRYTSGSAGSIDAVKLVLANVQEKGFKDAFIIAFYENKRITIQEAIKISEKN